MIETVYVLVVEFDYNGKRIMSAHASRAMAERRREGLGVLPEYDLSSLVIEEWPILDSLEDSIRVEPVEAEDGFEAVKEIFRRSGIPNDVFSYHIARVFSYHIARLYSAVQAQEGTERGE